MAGRRKPPGDGRWTANPWEYVGAGPAALWRRVGRLRGKDAVRRAPSLGDAVRAAEAPPASDSPDVVDEPDR